MAIIRIKERDIYLAYYTLERIEDIPEDIHSLYQLKLFLNGAMNMMKKKFQDGLDELNKVDSAKLEEPFIDMLKLSYQAYGNFCLGNIPEALNIYKKLENTTQQLEGDVYNSYLCKGILAGEAEEYIEAAREFEKAKKIFKKKVEPSFYLAVGFYEQVS